MDILYIDIYFLINLTVDMMSLYFASVIARAPMGKWRLFLVSFLLAALACLSVFFEKNILITLILYLTSCFISFFLSTKGVSLRRRIKFFGIYSIIMMLLGGFVSLVFNIISEITPEAIEYSGVDRRFLVMSLTILLAIAIIKMVCILFTDETDRKVVTVCFEVVGERLSFDALVDSGNLLVDPIDQTPVMLIKASIANRLFPSGIPSLDGEYPPALSRYIRIIPIKRNGVVEIEVGIRAQRASVIQKGKENDIKLTFIIDKEGGSFGGYDALIPASALDGRRCS
ncbi:MAG: sigma-E processing peptidase SpoIIGA [Clostridia bacterium]|nr:sigma-E processing peptidase SpoIIGA [Clostridia bacterium]